MPRLLLLSLLAAASVHAQEAARDLKVRFLAESALPELSQLVIAAGDKPSPAFDLPLNNVSASQAAPDRTFKVQAAGRDQTLASVTLPENGKEFIVLLIPTPEAAYKPVVIPDKDPSFEPGSIYFYNNTEKPMICHIGSSKLVLEPGIGRSLKPEGAENGVYDTAFSIREGAEIRQISSARWPVEPKMRSYIFFFVNPQTKRIDFRAVDEFVESGGKSSKGKGKSKARK
jgi:hypothetical protein